MKIGEKPDMWLENIAEPKSRQFKVMTFDGGTMYNFTYNEK